MDIEYDIKFEEMKKYIPFLESMIKRLESTSSASENPRQAQLDKIRSLRDLLMDKKKRMKMENLLKCEQVLVNLYAKVEQRDTTPVVKMASEEDFFRLQSNNMPDLNLARNKLKCAAAKLKEEPETLPEIARASQSEVDCTPGSKEPALFQRRPNKASITPPKHPTNVHQGKSSPQKNKRQYTRVLVSPEPSVRRWSTAEGTTSDIPLFSRRSPKRLHQRYSPSYYKRERKKIPDKEFNPKKHKDLNITLNVPEESLGSLNTKDILSRIINCSDGDVDIDTLRELRSQILGELKQTGASDDISDLILKSYKNKRKNKRREAEIEEGELSDSESEAIDSIYGSLVIVDQNKESKPSQATETLETNTKPRKIQICLVINSDTVKKNLDTVIDDEKVTDLKMCNETQDMQLLKSSEEITKSHENDNEVSFKKPNPNQDVITIDDDDDSGNIRKKLNNVSQVESNKGSFEVSDVNLLSRIKANSTNEDNYTLESMLENVSSPESDCKSIPETNARVSETDTIGDKNSFSEKNKCNNEVTDKVDKNAKELEIHKESKSDSNDFYKDEDKNDELANENCKAATDSMKQLQINQENLTVNANFYKPFIEPEDKVIGDENKNTKSNSSESTDKIEIPFLDSDATADANSSKADAVSEIDILQALKNEILNESLLIPVPKVDTPLLHQPKITKVANAQQVLQKKRISIETYKEKAVASASTPLFLKEPKVTHSSEENHKKQSLKLTEKECERFNFPSKLALNESSDDEEKDVSSMSLDDIYGDLAPKSPDHDQLFDSEAPTPVIIPSDPVRPREDIDLRNITSPLENKEVSCNNPRLGQVRPPLIDPRLRRDINQSLCASPNPFMNTERASLSSAGHYSNMTPSMTPNTRSFDMTPTYSPLETDSFSGKKHVYTPILPVGDIRDVEKAKEREDRRPRWDTPDSNRSRWENSDTWRNPSSREDYMYNKSECPKTPSHPFGRNDCSSTPIHNFGRSDRPLTPSHPFGRSECPSTPNHSFGRSDCPQTPSHPFGRTEGQSSTSYPFGRTEGLPLSSLGRVDCASKPSHQFGLLETPLTPIHPFGRSECPVTPNHPFGRSEMPITPNHPFGRADFHQNQPSTRYGRSYTNDPRLNRNSDNDNLNNQFYNNERSHSYTRDRNLSRFNKSDSFRNHGRDQGVGGTDRLYSNERNRNNFQRDLHRRETSIGRTGGKDYERDRQYVKERGIGNVQENLRSCKEFNSPQQREYSVGRSFPPSDTKTVSSNVFKNNTALKDNTLSVKSCAGRSFTIDTSVSSTFQEIMKRNKNDDAYDKRMQRCRSVGRTLARESSIGPSSAHISHSNIDEDKKDKFRRAGSVGRDIHLKMEKSFQDVKADFESYRKKAKEYDNLKQFHSKTEVHKIAAQRNKTDSYETKNDKLSFHNKHKHGMYSPTKNYRDPRLRREQDSKYRSDNRFSRDRNSYGIVYTNDNIAKGTILGSGYGVKNYKIPKIKRAPQERDKDMSDQSETMDNVKEKDENALSEEVNKSEKKVTSPRKTSDKSEVMVKHYTKISKSLRAKKAVIHDSDFEDNATEPNHMDKSNSVLDNLHSIKKNPGSAKTSPVPVRQADSSKKEDAVGSNDEIPQDDFSLDDLEFFSNNIESDTVLDNIDALIADLDNEIDPCKPVIAKICDEKMTEKRKNCTEMSGIKNVVKEDDTLNVISDFINENSTTDISPVIQKEQTKIDADLLKTDVQISENDADKSTERTILPKIDSKQESPNKNEVETDILKTREVCQKSVVNNSNNESLVSTTEMDKEVHYHNVSNSKVSDTSSIVCITPDSTNDTENVVKAKLDVIEGMPDSTDEAHHESNTEITTTKNTFSLDTKEVTESNSFASSLNTKSDPLDSLLSILQDKSKIKELLNKLGDHSSDNEKIKRKLEMLSKIVSDDEETNDDEAINKVTPLESSNQGKSNAISNQEQVNDIETKNKDTFERTLDQLAKGDDKCDFSSSISNDKLSDPKIISNELNKEVIEKTDATSETLANKLYNEENSDQNSTNNTEKAIQKKSKSVSKVKGKCKKKIKTDCVKRITRSEASNLQSEKPTKKKRLGELGRLQDDIREMFISDDILNATGIRMCRLAKLVNDKNDKGSTSLKEIPQTKESEPVVVLEKFPNLPKDEVSLNRPRKKPGPKPGAKKSIDLGTSNLKSKLEQQVLPKYTPGPKSKKKNAKKSEDNDPYAFETDSMAGSNSVKDSEKSLQNSSDSENDSVDYSKSPESSELLIEYKKAKKRKRPSWQAGIIKSKNKKKKAELKQMDTSSECVTPSVSPQHIDIPDLNCFTDKTYCFLRNVFTYSCRLCVFIGPDIVHHYKKQHPHSEIPLSRMSPEIAKEAIEQCEEINFTAISKIPTEKYVCRFCFKEFAKKKSILEAFFWHVVSTHTGEFKQLCSECINVTRCPFNLDIPPPPKDVKGQLIGYICGKCNFTQISLENLKTHVIVRHNDEQTEVYTINLAAMSKRTIVSLSKRCEISNKPRVLRSSRSNHSMTEASDEFSDNTETSGRVSIPELERRMSVQEDDKIKEVTSRARNVQSKITFETDDTSSETWTVQNEGSIINPLKLESDDNNDENIEHNIERENLELPISKEVETPEKTDKVTQNIESDDVLVYPHFKISYTDTGTREYVCCINRDDNHYRTTFQISMKKHVQISHKEKWDGYCFVCKLIVTSQGTHSFKDCLLHYFDKHMDDFPIVEKVAKVTSDDKATYLENVTSASKPKSYIQVRPMSELLSDNSSQINKDTISSPNQNMISQPPNESSDILPKIHTIVSLGASSIEPTQQSLNYPSKKNCEPAKEFKYEEIQANVMSTKHRVVLEAMMSKNKLVQLFKCAGRYCSFTSDSAEDALLHASTHKRIGGENALNCSYCDFDSLENAIDLIMHVFKVHGSCPFVCGQCFYRASASQLVCAHTTRVHQKSSEMQVLRSTMVIKQTANEDLKASMLSREVAVQYFICKNTDAEFGTENCKFRTYLPNKFYEHLVNKHASSTEHPCSICESVFSSPAELIQHLKTHGLKSYQCTWCVHGGDNEAELMAHASAKHPDKPPQAYLRMITNKDGSAERRVLPLVQFNKSKVSSEDVNPGVSTENSVREAERSLELEKLIVHTMVIESRPATLMESPQKDSEVACPLADDTPIEAPDDQVISNILDIPATVPIQATPPRSNTPAQSDIMSQLTPVLKKESTNVTPKAAAINTDVIYSLDSDEEDTKQGIIDLSLDDATSSSNVPVNTTNLDKTTENKVPEQRLFSCGNCRLFFTNFPDYEKHIIECFIEIKEQIENKDNTYGCPICKFQSNDKIKALLNISECSSKRFLRSSACAKRYKCGICSCLAIYMADIKTHLKKNHGVTKVQVFSNYAEDGQIIYKLQPSQAKKPGPKRKTSTGTTPAKTKDNKKYGPQEINKLPINPILDELVYCALCEFNTKVRLNMVRHLQMHAEQQPVAQTVPVNPVPHLETNEKHFDKMVNLASSSIVTRAPDKTSKPENSVGVTLLIPPEAAARYPKYVPERQRLTCGARGCSYISVDEGMLKYHWETLHEGTNDYQCVHCPPYQQLDTSRPLTATRIIAHLKMHDVRLFACSICSYYHHRRPLLEKHINEVHKNGQILVVREESNASSISPQSQQVISTPTMDLKPWQCGLCKFKSMLRQEVVEHCAKIHQSKMQFKCYYCPFRTSTLENVTKHQTTAHSSKIPEVFYYYYREGTIPDEDDGTPRWAKQRQKFPNNAPEVKTEVVDNTASTEVISTAAASTVAVSTAAVSTETVPTVPTVPKLTVDLNVVKKEIEDLEINNSIDDLCKQYGQFCDPNGLKYKCPLCKIVTEDTREAIQSHLYEELRYRKWACRICSYKAFHKKGLGEHMQAEHRSNAEPLELPLDLKIETWVNKLLQHQQNIINENRSKLTKQHLICEAPKEKTIPTTVVAEKAKTPESVTVEAKKSSMQELETAFGQFGESDNLHFSCPKCSFKVKEELAMQDHLETELTKIRWCCSNCADKFQTYHEAQFHCKSVHTGLSARPVEAIRDPGLRSAWIEAVIRVQKLSMNFMPVSEISAENTDVTISGSSGTINAASPEPFENSLLVVRYVEGVPTPEEETLARRKRSAPADGDSDDDRLIIVEANDKTKKNKCNYCNFKTRYKNVLQTHVLRHYNLKKFSCVYCDLTFSTKNAVHVHQDTLHHDKVRNAKLTETPKVSPLEWSKNKIDVMDIKDDDDDQTKMLCLLCLKEFTTHDSLSHKHDDIEPDFVVFGNAVFECGVCFKHLKDQLFGNTHHNSCHPNTLMNIKPLKIYYCAYCNRNCKVLRDLRVHHKLVHNSEFKFYVSYKKLPLVLSPTEVIDLDSDSGTKRTSDDTTIFPPPKRVAKKSTTKLPKVLTVARKSTTKLPLYAISDESDEEENTEYSYYGTKPLPLEKYSKVTTLMPFYSTVMPFSINNLKAVMKIDPIVKVKDFREC